MLEDGGGAEVVLEDGGSTAALGGGIRWQLKIAMIKDGAVAIVCSIF